MDNLLRIDGSIGEGGGQMVRTALALSAITGKAFKIVNIRAGRDKPGLKAQHVACIKALESLCSAKTLGAEEGSTELLFVPQKLSAKNLTIDIGTAGSLTLLLQAVLLPSLFTQKSHTLTIIGGTDVSHSMPIDYFTNVLAPHLRRLGGIDVKLLKRGYFPKGGGRVEIKIKPDVKRNAFDSIDGFLLALRHKSFSLTDQGTLSLIHGTAHASKDLAADKVAERMAAAAKNCLSSLGVSVDITIEYSDSLSTGAGMTLWAIFSNNGEVDASNPVRIGASILVDRDFRSENAGLDVARALISEIRKEAPVDSHLADNLVPLMALCRSSIINVAQITPHTRTNIEVCKMFLGDVFEVDGTIISSK